MYFFQLSIKGEREREKKGKAERNVQSSINNLRLILTRVISFGVPADDLYAFQILKSISTVDLLTLLTSLEKKLAPRD